MMNKSEIEKIQNKIYIARNTRIMLDSDLAALYGVSTKRLNESVKRNKKRLKPETKYKANIK